MANNQNNDTYEVPKHIRFIRSINSISVHNIFTKSINDLLMSYGAVILAIVIRRASNQTELWYIWGNDLVTSILISIAFALLLAKQKWRNHIAGKETGLIEIIMTVAVFAEMSMFVVASINQSSDWVLIQVFMYINFGISVIACFLSNIDLDEMEKEKKLADSRKQTNGSVGNNNFNV